MITMLRSVRHMHSHASTFPLTPLYLLERMVKLEKKINIMTEKDIELTKTISQLNMRVRQLETDLVKAKNTNLHNHKN